MSKKIFLADELEHYMKIFVAFEIKLTGQALSLHFFRHCETDLSVEVIFPNSLIHNS